jgi:hypothetical protein
MNIKGVWQLEYVNSKGEIELTGTGSKSSMEKEMGKVKEIPVNCKLVLRDDTERIVKVRTK